jgi:hypothetical protein
MYSLSDLGKVIADIQQKNQSGVLMVSGLRLPSENKTTTYSLRFESGDLARIGGGTNALGLDAVLELVALEVLTQTRWFPLNPTANWSGTVQVQRDELMGLLGLLGLAAARVAQPAEIAGGATGSTPQHTEPAGKALLEHVRAVFLNVYIGDTNADLMLTAKQYPPATEPDAFIEACVHLLEPMLGVDAARALLSKT